MTRYREWSPGRAESLVRRKSRVQEGAPKDDRTEVGKFAGSVSRKAAIVYMVPVP